MIHQNKSTNPLSEGSFYKFTLNGNTLYDAEVFKAEGCWATLNVLNVLEGPYKNNYQVGQIFDIRVSSYTFLEIKKEINAASN